MKGRIDTVEHENLAAVKLLISVLKMWINLVHVNLAILKRAPSIKYKPIRETAPP